MSDLKNGQFNQNKNNQIKMSKKFTRDDCTVIARNIKEVEDGIYQWEEYAMLTSDYDKLEEYFDKAEAAEILLGESEG